VIQPETLGWKFGIRLYARCRLGVQLAARRWSSALTSEWHVSGSKVRQTRTIPDSGGLPNPTVEAHS